MTGEARNLLGMLARYGLAGLNVEATAFSLQARDELVHRRYAVVMDGRTVITLEGARVALGDTAAL